MTQSTMTKEQEIDQAYAQMQAQEKQAKEAAWKQAENDQNKGKDQ